MYKVLSMVLPSVFTKTMDSSESRSVFLSQMCTFIGKNLSDFQKCVFDFQSPGNLVKGSPLENGYQLRSKFTAIKYLAMHYLRTKIQYEDVSNEFVSFFADLFPKLHSDPWVCYGIVRPDPLWQESLLECPEDHLKDLLGGLLEKTRTLVEPNWMVAISMDVDPLYSLSQDGSGKYVDLFKCCAFSEQEKLVVMEQVYFVCGLPKEFRKDYAFSTIQNPIDGAVTLLFAAHSFNSLPTEISSNIPKESINEDVLAPSLSWDFFYNELEVFFMDSLETGDVRLDCLRLLSDLQDFSTNVLDRLPFIKNSTDLTALLLISYHEPGYKKKVDEVLHLTPNKRKPLGDITPTNNTGPQKRLKREGTPDQKSDPIPLSGFPTKDPQTRQTPKVYKLRYLR